MEVTARLLKYSVVGGVCCIGAAYLFHRKFVSTVTNNPSYKEALDEVRKHKGTLHFLGEPLESKEPVLANKGMLLAGFSDVQIRVLGPKSNGIVFLKVVECKENEVKIESIHLQIGNDYSRRLVIRDSTKKAENSSMETQQISEASKT